jgi:hypothetical protein
VRDTKTVENQEPRLELTESRGPLVASSWDGRDGTSYAHVCTRGAVMTTRNLLPSEPPPGHVGKNLDDGHPAQPDTQVLLGIITHRHYSTMDSLPGL